MRRAASFLARRMLSSRLLLGGVMLTILITASLTAALATFGADGLPQAVHRLIARSPAVSVAVSGTVNAPVAAADARAVRTSMRAAFGRVPYQLDSAVWSDPLGLPSPRGAKIVPLVQAAAGGGIEDHAKLVAGTWPGPPAPGAPIGGALAATVAQRLRLAAGSELTVRDRVSGQRIRFRVTGLFSLRDPASPYWQIDQIGTSGVSVQQSFITYGPLLVSPAAFGKAGLAVGGASWAVLPDGARIPDSGITTLAARITRAQAYLRGNANLGGLQVTTGLPGLLTGLGQSLVVARSLLTMGMLQLLLLAAAALALAARLLASHRDEESALLSARGAARWQLVQPALAEAAVLGIVAAGAGVLAGSRLASLAMGSGPLRGTGLHVSGIPADAWLAALAVLVLSAAVLLWPAITPAPPGDARVRRGRQAAVAGIARAGADVALVALAVIAVLELRTYSAVAHPAAGGIGLDPVPVVAPTLALAGITLVPLRLLPVAARGIDGMTARTRRLGAALASWEISRRPLRQSGPVLLVILAVGTGSLALAQYQSWRQSAQDQAAFNVGSDVRVNTPSGTALATSGAIAGAPGVTSAVPVVSSVTSSGTQVIGLDARHAAQTVLLRPDLAAVSPSRLWHEITPPGAPPGLALPGRPAGLQVTATLSSGGARMGPAQVTLAIQDGGGIVYDVPAGTLPADGRPHPVTAVLSGTRAAHYPLRLLGLSLSYALPPYTSRGPQGQPASLAITGLATAGSAAGPYGPPFAGSAALASWRPAISAPELSNLLFPAGSLPPLAKGLGPTLAHPFSNTTGPRLGFRPGMGPSNNVLVTTGISESAVTGTLTVTATPATTIVPGIATRAYLTANHVGTGSLVSVTVGSVSLPVRIVAAVNAFPTVPSGPALVVDQTALQAELASQWNPPLPVTQWWLRTASGAVPRGLPRGTTVTDRAAQAAAALHDPLLAVPEQAALAIAIAATLLAAVGFSVSVAASLRTRQTQSAVLAALGVLRSGQTGQLCLEQLMLSVPAAVAGLVAGAGLAHVLVPAVTLTATAALPVPPVRVVFPLTWAAALALAVAAIPVLVAAVTVARRPDPAAQLRAAQAI